MLKRLSLFIAAALLSCAAFGQSAPGFTFGQVPTPGQWNSYFAGKMDFALPAAAGNVLTSSGTGWHSAPPANTGTVTSVSVNSANGFSGTVSTPSTLPLITLGTTVTGMVKGNGTALSAALAGMDYSLGTSANATGIVKNTTGTGALTTAVSGTDYAPGTASNATGIVKSTTGTGALTTAVASDFPILNQNTTGNAATATTAGNVTGIVAIANGGTGAATKAAAFNALAPMTTTGDLTYESAPSVASRLGIGATGQVLTVVGGAPAWASAGGVVPGYINGYTLSNDGTTPNSVLDIAAGTAADSTNAAMITGTAFTKSTASSWTAGSGNGGMGTGLTVAASTWYHVFAIVKGGSFDVYFDTSATAANAPASTTYVRYIGSFKTDSSSHILAFKQVGQLFSWVAPPADLSNGTSSTPALLTLSVPPGFSVTPQLLVDAGSTTLQAFVWSPLLSSTLINQCYAYSNPNNSRDGSVTCTYVQTNTSGQVYYESGGAATIITSGYINQRVASNF